MNIGIIQNNLISLSKYPIHRCAITRKKTVYIFFTCVLIFSGLTSCHKTKNNLPFSFQGTKLIAHHAYLSPNSDSLNKNYYLTALKNHAGIEVDVQMSQDRTLWLFHENQMNACGAIKQECLITKNDREIQALAQCENDNYCFTQLEDILQQMENDNNDKVISLDIKTWFDSKCSVYGNNIMAYYHNVAIAIVDIVKKHNLENRVMVESEISYLLGKIKRRSNIACYLSTFGDYQEGIKKAKKSGYTGISFQYLYKETITQSDIEDLHKSGLKIQLWVVNGDSMIKKASLLQPDFIQTDN